MFMSPASLPRQRGVSLLEVLISIIVIAIGVLGLAKMQALSIATTQISSSRGLIALQANSLAALLHANTGFWQQTAVPCNGATACTLTGATTAVFGTPPALSSCTFTTACNAQQMSALDLNTWMANMNTAVPTYSLNINCSKPGTAPTSCVLAISWLEKQQGMNQTSASLAAASSSAKQDYYLYVQP